MKIKKFPPKSKMNIGIYDADIHLFSEEKGWSHKLMQEWIYLNLGKVMAIDNEDSYAEVVHVKALTFAVYFSKEAGIAAVAHESLHITALIMEDIGECCIKNQEPWCYLHQLVVSFCVEGLGWKIKKAKS